MDMTIKIVGTKIETTLVFGNRLHYTCISYPTLVTRLACWQEL